MKKNSCFYFSSLLLLTPFASVGSFLTTNHNQKINKANAIVSSDDLQIQVNKNQTDKNKILVFATSTLDLLDKNPTIIWFCSKPTAIVFSKTESSLNEKIELQVIENTDVLIFAQFDTIFTSYELKLASVPSCDSDSLSNALVLYLSIGAGCLIAGFIAFTLINKRYENKLLNKKVK